MSYLKVIKKVVLVALRVFNLKRSTAGAFVVPFSVLSSKNYDRRYCVVVELVPLRGEKNLKKPCPQNPSGILFKISDKHPCPFIWEFPPAGNK